MNKLLLLSTLLLLLVLKSEAQISALTENGKQVTLYDNGTWKYSSDSTINTTTDQSIKINPDKFSKLNSQTFVAKSNVVNVGICVDPSKWTVTGHRDNETNPEYRFNLKSGNGMAMLESEKTEINLENMRNIALINAQKAAIDARITRQEYRVVNGNKVLFLEMAGTIQGIKFKYLGYYYSNPKGTIQFLAYTTEALYQNSKQELVAFLNGLIVI